MRIVKITFQTFHFFKKKVNNKKYMIRLSLSKYIAVFWFNKFNKILR